MPKLGARVTDEFYALVHTAASDTGLTVSDFVRQACETALANRETTGDAVPHREITQLHAQVQQKDDQIAQLHQLLGMAQKNVGTLTDQLTSAHAQLEDLRKPRHWWQRFT